MERRELRMNDRDKIKHLEHIFAPALAWYEKALGEHGRDSSYLYDETQERLCNNLTRGDAQRILEILRQKPPAKPDPIRAEQTRII